MNFDDDYNNSEFASAIENIKSALYDITSTINVKIYNLNGVDDEDAVAFKEELNARLMNIIKNSNDMLNDISAVDKYIDYGELVDEDNDIIENEEDEEEVNLNNKDMDHIEVDESEEDEEEPEENAEEENTDATDLADKLNAIVSSSNEESTPKEETSEETTEDEPTDDETEGVEETTEEPEESPEEEPEEEDTDNSTEDSEEETDDEEATEDNSEEEVANIFNTETPVENSDSEVKIPDIETNEESTEKSSEEENADISSEESENKVTEESEESTEEEPEEESTDNSVEKTNTDTSEVSEQNNDETPEEDNIKTSFTVNKGNKDLPKAILVTTKQYNNLLESLSSQKALCKFRNLLTTTSDISNDVDLEMLMNQANDLYKSGDIKGAEEIYNKISEINANKTENN